MTNLDLTTNPDWLALLRGICESPSDDLPRLVAADWLDENGRNDRAEFIRIQVERHALGKFGLSNRERRLVNSNWAMPFVREFTTAKLGDWKTGWVWRRGFVDSVKLSPETFARLAGTMCLAHPVLAATLIDREPTRWIDGGWCWLSEASGWGRNVVNVRAFVSHAVHEWLAFDLDTREDGQIFFSADSALKALSAACVNYARDLAGLPALTREAPASPAPPWLVLPS